MTYAVILSDKAKVEVEKQNKSGNKKYLKKLYALIEELEVHPTTSTGKPELLKHYQIPTWSKQITGWYFLFSAL